MLIVDDRKYIHVTPILMKFLSLHIKQQIE